MIRAPWNAAYVCEGSNTARSRSVSLSLSYSCASSTAPLSPLALRTLLPYRSIINKHDYSTVWYTARYSPGQSGRSRYRSQSSYLVESWLGVPVVSADRVTVISVMMIIIMIPSLMHFRCWPDSGATIRPRPRRPSWTQWFGGMEYRKHADRSGNRMERVAGFSGKHEPTDGSTNQCLARCCCQW